MLGAVVWPKGELPSMGGGEDVSAGQHWKSPSLHHGCEDEQELRSAASSPQSAKRQQPTTSAPLAKRSGVTFELLIIFPFWQPNKCCERVILSIHRTLRVNKHVREELQIQSWQPLLLLQCAESSAET